MGYNTYPAMGISAKEIVGAMRSRVHPKGFVATIPFVFASAATLLPHGGLTYFAHEVSKPVDNQTMGLLALAVVALASTVSIVVESKTLDKSPVCASPLANTAKILTGSSPIAATAGHAISFVGQNVVNPVNLVGLGSMLIGGDGGRLYSESLLAGALVVNTWNVLCNKLVEAGSNPRAFADGVKNGIKKGGSVVTRVFTRKDINLS